MVAEVGVLEKMRSCYDCEYHRIAFYNEYLLGCTLLKDWLTREEFKNGKRILNGCPLQGVK